MSAGGLWMNASERDRAQIIRLAIEGRMSQRAGA
jgi:hypothetical protein